MTYPTIKMKITPAPKLRGKMDVRFPANVEASAPILLDKSGGAYTFSFDANSLSSTFATAAQGALADTAIQSVVAGSNVTVDNTDPANPVISSTASGSGDMLASVYDPNSVAGDAFDSANHEFIQSGTGAAARSAQAKVRETVSVKDFGAVGDTKVITGATSISSGSAALTLAGAGFTSGDVGKKIYVPGAGAAGVTLSTTILSYTSATQVTLNANASTTLSAVSKQVTFGTDDTAAIQAAITSLSNGGRVLLSRGGYLITTQIDVAVSGVALIGEGRGATKIASAATGHTFQIGTGLYYTEVRDMQITRASYPATSGQDGIHFTNLTERALVENVEVTYHYIGIRCGITSFSKIINALCDNNYSHGMHVTNADGAGGLQWTIINPLVQRNDGYGILYNSPSGNAAVGELINPSTYANKLGGLWFVGTDSSHALNAIRIRGGFAGEDGSHGVYFDTYGSATCRVEGTYTEAAGTAGCGVNQGTSATNVGGGIRATANNTAVEILNCHAIAHSYSGIVSSAARTLISGCGTRINGAAAVGGELSGIELRAGNGTIVGCSSKAQTFGVYLTNDNHIVVGNDLTENTGPLGATPTLKASVVMGNLPATTVIIQPATNTGHGDSDYTISAYDDFVYTSAAFTAPRTWTLPAANTVPVGKRFRVLDVAGGVTASNTLTIARAGSDTINGVSSYVVSTAYDGAELISDGNSKWTVKTVGLDGDLNAIAALSTTGLATRTAANTWALRTITGTANEITATNGDGVSGNPTLSLPSSLTFTGKTVTGGTYSSPALTTPTLGVATATSINKVAITAPASSATLTIPDGVTLTGPASSGTAMTLGNTETVTGVKTFGSAGAVGRLKVAGTTSGSTVIDAKAVASGTLTLPAATDTLVGKATTDTLTNKTFDTAGAGNSFSINGVAATANTGTGAVARATSPTFVTPTLGAATATTLAVGGALPGGAVFAVVGTAAVAAGNAYAMYMNPTIQPNSGSLAYFGFFAGVVATSTSNTVSYGIGLYVDTMVKGGTGTVTSAYGLYVGNQTIGGTNNYAAYFGGNVTIGSETGAGRLSIAGGKVQFAAGTTSYPSFNITEGAAPSSPSDGDVWRENNTNTGLKVRINGVTKTITVS